ncbi:MAG: NPCBM/NEW2 domain-containing protein [Algicola sp.]|nr:NPCBM/NEW2 domain-containing protein [Algicola sp.]
MHYKSLLALALALALNGQQQVQAKELGDLISITDKNGKIDIVTKNNERVNISLLKDNVIRLQAGVNNTLTQAKNKAVAIVPAAKYAKVNYTLSEKNGYRLLETSKFALRIYPYPLRFEAYKADNKTLVFKELKPIDLAKNGSVQTLSSTPDEAFYGGGQQNGQYEFNGKTMEISYSGGWEEGDRPSPAPFYMTNKGYGVLRNTWADGSYDFRSDAYLSAAHEEQRFDGYYFFGDSIKTILAEYTELSGRAPLLPRWAFEYGDADCYNDGDNIKKPGTVPSGWSDGPTGTTLDVITTVAAKYREHDMPGGWILPNDGYGCGYSDLPKVVAGLKKYGFRTGLWTENGVEKIAWEVGDAGSRAQKLDVAWTGKGYQFALDANADAAKGIIDNSDSRPFLWTVMGWAGIQRYAVTWTGDQSGSWDYIRWHVSTLIGSGLSGQVYATGDVDGIFGGSPETYMRDLQWKAFTPVLMGMSGWSKAARKHPWWFEEPYRSINRKYLKLKMRLMPYMYTTARMAETTGAPIVRGLMWDHPKDPNAGSENYKNQFFLGKDFLVAPVYESQSTSKGWRQQVYLPEGEWVDYWDGTVTTAGKNGVELNYPITLDRLPLLVRAGAIIPMYPESLYDGQVAKDEITLDIYPHGDSQYTLYEDDGNTRQYKNGAFSEQLISVSAPKGSSGNIKVSIAPVLGQYEGMEQQRAYQLIMHSRVKPDAIKIDGAPLANRGNKATFDKATTGWFYDADDKYGTVYIKLAKASVRQEQQVDVYIQQGLNLVQTKPYPTMPDYGTAMSMDALKLISRPLEEGDYTFEKAIDGDPATWFRTSRDQSLNIGTHEFVLYLGDRTAISGFDILGRTDKWWKYGQLKDYEIYMTDMNGDWGEPAHTGTLNHVEGTQEVRFKPIIGRMLRFRALSLHDPDTEADTDSVEHPVLVNAPFNALQPNKIGSLTISEFKLHQQALPKGKKQKVFLSELNRQDSKNTKTFVMNGLKFKKGLGVFGNSQVDYTLSGNWQVFRADVGIDDNCKNVDGINFQVWGDNRLLFDSGTIVAPAVVKPELDIRSIKKLSLRTVENEVEGCANWANAAVVGFKGDEVATISNSRYR